MFLKLDRSIGCVDVLVEEVVVVGKDLSGKVVCLIQFIR